MGEIITAYRKIRSE